LRPTSFCSSRNWSLLWDRPAPLRTAFESVRSRPPRRVRNCDPRSCDLRSGLAVHRPPWWGERTRRRVPGCGGATARNAVACDVWTGAVYIDCDQ
jgi:hypothetical protein